MRLRRTRPVSSAQLNRGSGAGDQGKGDGGFTLVELVVVTAILPIIIGALAVGLIAVFSLQSSVSSRLGDSSDAQMVAAVYGKDVQGASGVTTNDTPLCGPTSETQEIGFQMLDGSTVSYVEQLQGGTSYTLVRNFCPLGKSVTPQTSNGEAFDLKAPCLAGVAIATCNANNLQQKPVAYSGSTAVATTSATVTPVQGVSTVINLVSYNITEPKSKYSYSLAAVPVVADSTSSSQLGTVSSSGNDTCGTALAGTGTYASNLCFVGFTNADILSAMSSSSKCTSGQTGYQMSVSVPGGYTMSFCFNVQTTNAGTNSACWSTYGQDVIAATIPVSSAYCSNGQGFLGNYNNTTNLPFYTGIGCPATTSVTTTTVVSGQTQILGTPSCIKPALFQLVNGGNDTITLSNIQLIDPQGAVATGYEVITADAETVDFSNGGSVNNIANGGSYIKWTSLSPTGSPLPFELLPNSPTSVVGNACNMVPTNDELANPGYTSGYSINNGDDPNNPVSINGQNYYGSLVGNGTTTGVGTSFVECYTNWNTTATTSDIRDGTAILTVTPPTVSGAAEPVSIQAQLQGEGYNAVAFGLYLP